MKTIHRSYFFMLLFQAVILGLASCNQKGQGCTDPRANNLVPGATENDGSCTYDQVWLVPVKTLVMDEKLSGTSGLISWNGRVWTHNDYDDTQLYALDTATAEIVGETLLPEVGNSDWEDIAQDGEYIYVGDFGNNASGNRTDLHILRVEMASLISGSPSIDTLWFSYSDQEDLSPAQANQTDFDCEAMVVSASRIYLFTKQWLSGQTTLYVLPKEPGTHVAQKKEDFNIQGLVTGATLLDSEKLLMLCGYTGILQPFVYLFYDYGGEDFFSGNKRRVHIQIPFLQVEGITSSDGLTCFLSNESFVLEPASNLPQQLLRLDLSGLLGDYLNRP